jgi:Dehydrogenases with different specificities (related to short-chain alcohol dehydrogenases)
VGRLPEKVAVVTGGSRNIGRGICHAMCHEGARLWILDIDDAGARATTDSLRSAGRDAHFLHCDVTRPGQVDSAVQQVLGEAGRIDILVNNVGGSSGLRLNDVDDVTLERNLAKNFKSAFNCTRAVCPSMSSLSSGSVVFISSVNAMLGGFGEVAYSAAKAGLHSLVKSLTAEYSPQGLRFNVVCLGSVPGDSLTWQKREQQDPGTLEKLARAYPMRRVGTPEDAAAAVVFFASDESSWITGVVLPVDGGITATGLLHGGDWWTSLG